MGQRKGKGKGNSSPPPPWIELPRDVTANILRRLSPDEVLFSAQIVCSTWRSVCGEPSLWRVINMKQFDNHSGDYADRVCRRAVDRSQGGLIDISIKHLISDDLLLYISERSKNLKNLSLGTCQCLSPHVLTAAVKNLSSLQELHLFFSPEISDSDIETIGVSCPMLTSFTLNNFVFYEEEVDIDDSLALSIAKNMPKLRRLRLVGNSLSNEGLLDILDGYPNLESLDLLQCFNVDLECDDLGRRCSEQVKKLRGPRDSTTDCEWDDRVYAYVPEVEEDLYDYDNDNSSVGCYSDYEDDRLSDP